MPTEENKGFNILAYFMTILVVVLASSTAIWITVELWRMILNP